MRFQLKQKTSEQWWLRQVITCKVLKTSRKKVLTKSDLEWKRNSKIFVPIAPLGGSSNAVKARVDNTTFKSKKKNWWNKIGNQFKDPPRIHRIVSHVLPHNFKNHHENKMQAKQVKSQATAPIWNAF